MAYFKRFECLLSGLLSGSVKVLHGTKLHYPVPEIVSSTENASYNASYNAEDVFSTAPVPSMISSDKNVIFSVNFQKRVIHLFSVSCQKCVIQYQKSFIHSRK